MGEIQCPLGFASVAAEFTIANLVEKPMPSNPDTAGGVDSTAKAVGCSYCHDKIVATSSAVTARKLRCSEASSVQTGSVCFFIFAYFSLVGQLPTSNRELIQTAGDEVLFGEIAGDVSQARFAL